MTDYYVRLYDSSGHLITGTNGATWFEVPLPSSLITNAATIGGGATGAGTGKATFDPLSLTVNSNSVLEDKLITLLGTGETLQEVEVVGVSGTGANATALDDYVYTGVNVTGLTVGGAADTINFSYQATQTQHDTGTTVDTTQWSAIFNNAQLDPAAVAHVTPGPFTPPSGASLNNISSPASGLTYYVEFVPNTGSKLTDDHGGNWLAVTDPSFSLTNVVTIGSATGGGAGKASFGTLSLTLGQPSAATIALETALESGQQFKDIEIAGYNSAGNLVEDYTFGTAFVTSDAATSPSTTAETFGFAYGAVQEAYTSYVKGKAQTPVINGWSVIKNAPDPNLPDTAPAVAPKVTAPATDTVYYLRLYDSSGHLITGTNGATWFEVPLPSSLITNVATIGGGATGAGAGKATFDPLSLTVSSNSVLEDKLITLLGQGETLKEIEVVGVSGTGAKATALDDYVYTGVNVTGLTVGANTDTINFAYAATQTQHDTGTTVDTTQWSAIFNNAQLDPAAVAHVTPGPFTPPTGASLNNISSTTSGLTYYVEFVPNTGSKLTDDNGGNWLAVTDPSFSLTDAVTIGSGTSGAGAGKASFGTLSLTLGQPSAATIALETALETGQQFKDIEIAGYNSAGKLVEDYTFGTAFLTSDAATSPNTTAETFGFVYGTVQEAYTSYIRGNAQPPVINGWNRLTNTPDPNLPDTAPTAAPKVTAPATDSVYYLRLYDSSGHLITGTNGATWFEVPLPTSLITNAATIGGGATGAGTGKATFDPLSLTVNSNSVLEDKLITLLGQGETLQEIEVVGVSGTGAKATPLDDYVYTGVNVTGLTVGANTDTINFAYEATQTQHDTGTAMDTTQWSAKLNVDALNPLAVGHVIPAGPFTRPTGASLNNISSPTSGLTYYVEFVPKTGSVLTDDNGGNWLAVTNPSFSLTNTIGGKASFGTLSLTLGQPSAATIALETALETGRQFNDIQIAGYNSAGKLVEDYTFGTAFLTSDAATSPNTTAETFGFVYGAVQEAYTSYIRGNAQAPVINGWNRLTNTPDPHLPHTAPETEPSTACYCRGTSILTERGDVAVEDLAIGDSVITARGDARPIKWIGRRSYGGRFVMGRKDILPICIKAGALEATVPKRDLWISPQHAMYLQGVLIEAKDLLNGTSIVQARQVDKVEYFHIELESHDLIVAEGALSETFIDDDSRGVFHNAHVFRALFPDAAEVPASYCAARCADGYEVETARRHIAQRAGLLSRDEPARTGNLRGFVDRISARTIEGWAQNADNQEIPVCLEIRAGGRLLGQTLANVYRKDLAQADIGSGRHGFKFTLPAGITFDPHTLEVRRPLDGARLALSSEAQCALPSGKEQQRGDCVRAAAR